MNLNIWQRQSFLNVIKLGVAAVLVSIGGMGRADAACPGIFNGLACDGGATYDICEPGDTAYDLVCDLNVNGDTQDALGYFVLGSSTQFRAYGTDAAGNDFCCEIAVPSDFCTAVGTLVATGSGHSDQLYLFDQVDGRYMDCSYSEVYGQDGDDLIKGSTQVTNYDTLYGDQNADTIYGYEGNDIIFGDYGDDTIYGGSGGDTIYGGYGNDRIKAQSGQDAVQGDAGDDQICGGEDADNLQGEDGDDQVTGEAGNDTSDGGAHTVGDTCETAGGLNCETYTANMVCPW